MVAIGKIRRLRAAFSTNEDGTRGLAFGLEKCLERVLFLPFDLETISLGILSHLAQPICLLSFSVDAAPVHEEEDRGGQKKISDPFILRRDIHIPFSDIAW